MEPVDWGQAFHIVLGGLAAVFCIMTLLAITTHFMGKIIQGYEKRKKEKGQAKAGEAA